MAAVTEPMGGGHLPAHCCCHVFTPSCPLDCLGVVLGASTFHALARVERAPFPPPVTVGQVIDLLRAGQLGQAAGIGPRRLGEIEAGLVLAGLSITGTAPATGGGPGRESASDRPPREPAVADQLLALSVDRGEMPGLTLVLPAGLGKDRLLAGLAEAIASARVTIAGRARLFRRRTGECAASGDLLGQVLCQGQVLAGEEAAATIDEALVETFELRDQYEAQLGQHTSRDDTGAGQQGGTGSGG